METFVIVGAGATGAAVARVGLKRGAEVIMVTRSGSTAGLAGVRPVAGDATNAEFLSGVAKGATVLFNCANPAYHRWLTDWPPLAASLLDAARESGAVLATLSNLYAYGAPSGPMRPTDPLNSTLPKAQVRAKMWSEALAAHERGEIRATEVRASDFIGSGSRSLFEQSKPALLKGKSVSVIGNPDMVHSWTFTGDVGRTLVAAATDEQGHGKAWHAVTNPPKSTREVLAELAEVAGAPAPKLRIIPTLALKAVGLFSPMMRELPKTLYQFQMPYVIDDEATRETFSLKPTPWKEVLADVVNGK